MGLFDKLKGKVKGAIQGEAAPPPPQQQQQQEAPHDHGHDHSDHDHDDEPAFDTAGFDPGNDQNTFFNAVLHMESEGEYGGTDESRAEIMSRFGIRDRTHWRHVKECCYAVLAKKYGSGDEVGQQEMNWRMQNMQDQQAKKTAAMMKGGGFEPVEGLTLESWAAMNAAIVGGANYEDVIKGSGLDRARWDRVNAEWNARMAKDTTFAIATTYGNAFQAASKGKYSANVKDAMAARAENRDLGMPPPITWEQFFEFMYEQSFAFRTGKDPIETLKGIGLTVVDWTDLGTVMGYHMNRNGVRDHAELTRADQAAKAKVSARYPAVDAADIDIKF